MNDQSFEDLDKSLMDRLKKVRSTPVPASIRKGFTESVEKRILQRIQGRNFGFAFAAASAAVLVVAASAVFFFVTRPKPQIDMAPSKSSAPMVTSMPEPVPVPKIRETRASAGDVIPESKDVTDEIEILRELGVWTDEDEEAIGVTVENSLSDLELEPNQEVSTPVRTDTQMP